MKKTMVALLTVALLVLSLMALPVSAADDFVVFADGKFQGGGEILEESGTIIDSDGNLLGGEEINEGEIGSGWFQIKLDDTEGDANWKAHKYLKITCRPTKMGDPNRTGAYGCNSKDGGGTIKGVKPSGEKMKATWYDFKDIEANGKTMGNNEDWGTYYLDTSKFILDANWLTLTHCAAGYVVSEIVLTDNLGGDDAKPADTTAANDDNNANTTAAASDVKAPTTAAGTTTSPKTPSTGVEGIGFAVAVAGIAAAGLVIASKKKSK